MSSCNMAMCSSVHIQAKWRSAPQKSVKRGHEECARRPVCDARHVHFLGVGGTGMLPLAVLAAQSMKVTGWDDGQSQSCSLLQSAGVDTKLSLEGSTFPDTVVASSAIGHNHTELRLARKKGMLVMSRQEWFQAALNRYSQVAVAGSHGKTTTTALSAFLLYQLGHTVPFVCGGEVPQLPLALLVKKRRHDSRREEALVIEADEFCQAFLGLTPMIAVLTNVDHEHVDCYPYVLLGHGLTTQTREARDSPVACRTIQHVDAAFTRFLGQVRPGGVVIAPRDDPGSRRVIHAMHATGMLHSWKDYLTSSLEQRESCTWLITYGSAADCDVRVSSINDSDADPKFCTYSLTWKGLAIKEGNKDLQTCFHLQLAGQHNALNAAAAVLASSVCAVMQRRRFRTASEAFFAGNARLCSTVVACCMQVQHFTGAKRRMQLLNSCTGIQFLRHCGPQVAVPQGMHAHVSGGHVYVYDDYGHHPTEIRATLSAVQGKHVGAAVVAVWQPISRGRLRSFMHEFSAELQPASRVVIAPIDTSREAADAAADKVLVREACSRLNMLEFTAAELGQRACIAETGDHIIKVVHEAMVYTWKESTGVDIIVLFMGSGNISQTAQKFSGLLGK